MGADLIPAGEQAGGVGDRVLKLKQSRYVGIGRAGGGDDAVRSGGEEAGEDEELQ